MRGALAMVVLVAACGGGGVPIGGEDGGSGGTGGTVGDPDFGPRTPADLSSVCESLVLALTDIAAANRQCQHDSDCFFVGEVGWDAHQQLGCHTFTNGVGLMQMAPLRQKFKDESCPFACMALMPRCNAGLCTGPSL